MRLVAAMPACALLAGAALGLRLPDVPLGFAAGALAAGLLIAFAGWHRRAPLVVAAGVTATFAVGGAALGASAWRHAWRPPLRELFDEVAENGEASLVVVGILQADAALTEAGVALSVDVEGVAGVRGFRRAEGGVALTVAGALARGVIGSNEPPYGAWRAGRRIRAPATLRRAAVYLDPGVPDHERALARRGTTLVGSVKSGALVDVLERGSWIDEALAATRAHARRSIASAIGRWDAQAAAIVAAIVIGDRAGLDLDVQRRLQEAGTYHVIAISGGNIAILAALVLGAFRVAGWFGRAAMLAAIVLLVAYARLVGGGASVDRATLMASIYLAGRAIDQRGPPLNVLCVAGSLIIAGDPLSVADPAFVLTFGATLAILVAVPVFQKQQRHEARENTKGTVSWLTWAAQRFALPMFVASLATEAVLFPVGALIFSRVTFAGLGLNFLAIPLMAVAQLAGMAVVPLALATRVGATCVGWIAYVAADGLVWSAALVRFVPIATYRIAPPSLIAVALYYGSLVSVVAAQRVRESRGSSVSGRATRGAAVAIAVASAAWILLDPTSLLAARGDCGLHVTFIDVGQGDAAFVRFPRGGTLLVDAGGLAFTSGFDVGDRIVGPVLRDAGRYRLDYLALTHGDPDHIGGAPSLVREFRPREVWEGIPVPRFEPLTRLRLAVEDMGSRWANVYAGDRVEIDGVAVIAHHPHQADWERQKVRNDDSLVIELRWRSLSIVLTGDIGKAVEPDVAAAMAAAPLRVVKIAHHGSLTSSGDRFVGALRPQVAVVSVGRMNRFGHPAPAVIERYRAVGAEIFRTDQDGAVTVDSDGETLKVSTFTGRRLSLSSNATTKTRRHEEETVSTHAQNPDAAVR